MTTIRLDIEDSRVDKFLSLVSSLGSGMIKNFVIEKADSMPHFREFETSHIEEVSDEENEYYKKLLQERSDEDKEIVKTKFYEI